MDGGGTSLDGGSNLSESSKISNDCPESSRISNDCPESSQTFSGSIVGGSESSDFPMI